MWQAIVQVVVVGVSVTLVTAGDDNVIDYRKHGKGFDLLCGLFTKAEKGAKENYIDKLKDDSNYQWFNKGARDSAALKTEVDKVKELEDEVQSHENSARTAFRKAAYGDDIETENADKTFGSRGENQPCNETSRSTTIPKEIVCLCSSASGATESCFVAGTAQNQREHQTPEDRLQLWKELKGRCTVGSGSVEVTVKAIKQDLEDLRNWYSDGQNNGSPQPPPAPPQPPFPPHGVPPPPRVEEEPDPLASKPWVEQLNQAMGHMNKRDAALQKLREKVKKLKGTYGKAKNEEEVKALKESGAGAEGAQPSRTAPQTAARKDSDAQPTQTQKQNIASFPSLKITLLSVSLCFI
ncbi:hypothetical protein, conserved [Trypanosoma brucei brucei TREU927]|uniref:Trypanosome variant surface glycoprotein B-type N-terminal domain-containing protein n=1 Tax=Trypanosoma brucei brucei (strain 927/4 GUTat10.1) TaxID=185431 RepID=Q585B6_TRYB2|nr:hypothetical protein, conserved [Trypanosoma brucei brucei TREU927]AAX80386.1 hypothetical protein, conserved [Trypanosoma brucei]AAZ11694.1 hypothetical protein, conserved [Trypanosoma brucei brucei TREU927]